MPLQGGQSPNWSSLTNTTETMLASQTIGLNINAGYAPTVDLGSVQTGALINSVNELFGPGVAVKDYSCLTNAANQHVTKAAKTRDEITGLKEYCPENIKLEICELSEKQIQLMKEKTIIDVPSIPDPSDNEIPFIFNSQGEVREELTRLYKHLYKIKPTTGKREKARNLGIAAVEEADASYSQGEPNEGQFYKDLAEGFLDIAIGLDPITGLARSTYELILGRNLVTGAKLGAFERSVAFLGVITLGAGNTIAKTTAGVLKITGKVPALSAELKIAEKVITEGTRIVESGERNWKSVKGLLHTVKGNAKIAADGTFKLKNGMHTEKGLEHFIKLNSGKGKTYTIQSVETFAERNLAESVIFKQKLPNGVSRLQLPREAWHNSDSFGRAGIRIDEQNIRGIKTLWPESFSIADIAEATETILQQNIGALGSKLNGIYKEIKVAITRDSSGKVISSFPSWNQ
ncbi:MAG: pre-toxin TG domain-containing protein [Bdellovibrionia bacterium]